MILGRRLAHLPPLGVIGTALRLTAVAYVPVVVLSGPGESPSATAIDSVVALAVVCTALAFILFFVLIAEIGPMRATVITYVNPAVAVLLGVAILGEEFSVAMGAGFVLVLVGSVLATLRSAVPAAQSSVRLNLRASS